MRNTQHTLDWQLERLNGEDMETIQIELSFDWVPYIPATGPSFYDPGSPAEGGYAEDLAAFQKVSDGTREPIELTAVEGEEIEDWLARNWERQQERDNYYAEADRRYDEMRDEGRF